MLILVLLNLNTGYADIDAVLCIKIMSLCCTQVRVSTRIPYVLHKCFAFSYPCLSLSKNHELTAIEFQKHERSAQCTACIGVYILEIVRSNSIHLTAAIKTLQVFTKSKENDNFLSNGYCNVAERRFLEDRKRNDKYGKIHSRPVSYPA